MNKMSVIHEQKTLRLRHIFIEDIEATKLIKGFSLNDDIKKKLEQRKSEISLYQRRIIEKSLELLNHENITQYEKYKSLLAYHRELEFAGDENSELLESRTK